MKLNKVLTNNFLIFLSFTIIIFSSIFYFLKIKQIEKKEIKIKEIYDIAKNSKDIRFLKKEFFLKYKKTDPYFLDKHLKSFSFKKEELKNLKKIIKEPAFSNSEKLKEKIKFLENNKLIFFEKNIEKNSFIKEVEESLKKEIEVNSEDIKKILSFLEGVSISKYIPFKNSPYIIIKRFSLIKEKEKLNLKNLSIIKREMYEN